MRILFDQGTPVPLRSLLSEHTVDTAYEMGWSTLENGALLSVVEQAGYDVFVTTDRNLSYQQNLQDRNLTVVVLSTPSWPRIKAAAANVVEKINNATSGEFLDIVIP